jgi:hypothetical protein
MAMIILCSVSAYCLKLFNLGLQGWIGLETLMKKFAISSVLNFAFAIILVLN